MIKDREVSVCELGHGRQMKTRAFKLKTHIIKVAYNRLEEHTCLNMS